MKKLNVMIYAETLEALCELPNEDVGALVKHINDWNNGKEVVIENPFHKGMWKVILPDLERNKETYLTTLENRQRAGRENGKLGGRPRKDKETQENPIGFSEKVNNPNSNYNYNNNSSKEELLSGIEQPKSSEDDSVVSKGLETLEQTFPERKRAIGIDEINLWNSISQPQKSNLIKMAKVYIRNEEKKENGKFIKQLSKWMKEQIELGIPEEIKKPVKKEKRLFEMTNAVVWDRINQFGFTNNQTDLIYQILNTSLDSKEEFVTLIKTSNKEDLESLIK
jgi:hypothetical protein